MCCAAQLSGLCCLQVMASLPEGSQPQLQLQVVQLQQRVTELEAELQQLQSEAEHLAMANKELQGNAQGVAAAAAAPPSGMSVPVGKGVKAIKTGKSLNDTMSLPGTPGGGTPVAAAGCGARYSSDGGSSTAGNLHGTGGIRTQPSRFSSSSNTGGKAASAADTGARPGSAAVKPAAAPPQDEQQQEQQAYEGSSKPSGVSYAPQQWEESKQLQAKIESLRWADYAFNHFHCFAVRLQLMSCSREQLTAKAQPATDHHIGISVPDYCA